MSKSEAIYFYKIISEEFEKKSLRVWSKKLQAFLGKFEAGYERVKERIETYVTEREKKPNKEIVKKRSNKVLYLENCITSEEITEKTRDEREKRIEGKNTQEEIES